jgi:hypothetical protein
LATRQRNAASRSSWALGSSSSGCSSFMRSAHGSRTATHSPSSRQQPDPRGAFAWASVRECPLNAARLVECRTRSATGTRFNGRSEIRGAATARPASFLRPTGCRASSSRRTPRFCPSAHKTRAASWVCPADAVVSNTDPEPVVA